jgi:hypothetical protein
MNCCAAAIAKLQVAGYEVGVEVGQKDMADLETEFLRIRQVLFDIALWIDNDCGRTGFVAQQIGGMRQATEIILFQNHENSFELPKQIVFEERLHDEPAQVPLFSE